MSSGSFIFLISFILFAKENFPASSEIVEKQDSVLDCYFTENLEPKKQPTCDVIAKEIKRSKFNEKVKCSFLAIPGHLRKNISMDEISGIIHLTTSIDREAICLAAEEDCFIKVDVVIKPVATLKIIKVRLHIIDINDNAPLFPTPSQHFEVSETAEPGASFILPDATDPDSGRNGLYGYRLIPQQENFELLPMQQRSSISPSGSQEILVGRSVEFQTSSPIQTRQNHLSTAGSSHLRLSLKNHLDREIRDVYIFKIEAFDGGDPRRSSTMLINITVLDSNDNVPQFDNSSYEIQVREDVPINTTLLRLRARDSDQSLNGLIRYHFTPETLSRYGDIYLLDEVTGRLTTRAALDYETGHLMMLYVTASDQGPNEKLSSQALVVVKLQDVNDNTPIIKINSQSQPLQSLKSKIPSSKSNPVANTRSYFNASKVDFNPRRNLSRNKFQPQVFENSGVGTFVAHITVEDADSEQNGKFECKLFQHSANGSQHSDTTSLNELSKEFLLSQMYQTEFKLITARIFDRETSDREQAVIHCSDFGEPSLTSSLTLNVQILDRNDNAPTFSKQLYETSANEDTPIGTSLIQLTAVDVDEGLNGEVNFSLTFKNKSAPLIDIDSTTGVISTLRALELKPNVTKFEVLVIVSDKGSPVKTSTAKLVIHVHDVMSERTDFTQQLYRFSVKENSNSNTFLGNVEVKSFNVPPTRILQYFLSTTPCRINATYHAVFEFANLPFRIEADKGTVWSSEQLDREEQEFYSFFVVAYLSRKSQEVLPNYKFGVGSYQAIKSKIISCAVIEIVVEDQNDNVPYFTFPSTGNDHVYFSLDEAPGLAITKLSAYDPDFIHNANLKFCIESGNEDNLFELESSSGMLFLSRYIEMSDIDQMRANTPPEALEFHRQLVVSVTDQGFPSLNSTSVLVLVARNELLQPGTKSLERLHQSDRNKLQTVYHLLASEDLAQTLAITLAVILVLISSLIAAICLIKNKQRRRERNNCVETNANKNAHKSSSCDNDIGNTTSKMLLLSGDVFPRPQNSNKSNSNNNNNNNKSATSGLFGTFGKKKYQKAAVENHYSQSNELAMNWRPFYSLNIANDELPSTKEETETLFHPNVVNIASTSTSKFEFPTKIIDISSLDQEAIDPVNSKPCSMVSFVKHFYNDFIKASSPTSESNSDSGRGQSSGDDVTKVSQRHVIFKRNEDRCNAEMKL